MPRHSREQSGTGVYHVMLRGVDRQDLLVSNICEIQTLERKERNEILETALINGVGVRQLARLTGVSYGIIQRINEKVGQRTVP